MGGTTVSALGYERFGADLAIDAAAIAILAYAVYFRRHRRRDLLMAYVCFNVIAVWESEDTWQDFQARRLAPAIAALGGPVAPRSDISRP